MEWVAYTMAGAFTLVWVVLLYKFIKITRGKD